MEKTMESPQFDAALGGDEHLPNTANSLKFAASRSIEIAAMTESILRPSATKLIFQNLPVHMRRRVMSHNSKRLPVKLRRGHLEQMKKSGLSPKQKRPSRKYRRRPANLLKEYNRRQKGNVWLETHIWHAKRFHMTQRWGHRLAYSPCDKAFRACYRASSAHCLLQDISYYTPIQISGPVDLIGEMFKSLTNNSCGLGICAKAYINGSREGAIQLYKADSFPYGYIGKICFIWVPSRISIKTLWLFVHPSQASDVKSTLSDVLCSDSRTTEEEIPEKRRKITNKLSENIQFKVLPGNFNRFRLTGPNSHSVLLRSLKCVEDDAKVTSNEWISNLPDVSGLHLKEKHIYWHNLSLASSPSQLPSKIVIGLIVKDPRLSRPKYRTKAVTNGTTIETGTLVNIPEHAALSPLWDTKTHESIKRKILTNGQFIQHITKTQLVPGEVYEDDPALQHVPVVVIQRPGSQNSEYKRVGYGNGWDIIIPSGYGLPFWQTFIMFGARSGGIREMESLAFEMGECYLPPDSNAGKEEEKRIESELRERYFRLPPSKRVNYIKLGITSPFICPWKTLLKDWRSPQSPEYDFFVLRNKNILDTVQDCLTKKKSFPILKNSENCLVAVYLQILGKGSLKRHGLICLPQEVDDLASPKTLFEPHHPDTYERTRKEKRVQHLKDIKRWRKNRVKLRKKGAAISKQKTTKRTRAEPSEYVKSMRELWLPSDVKSVRLSTSREILGFITQAAFSFSEAKSCGIGYVAYNALSALIELGHNKVLVRNTSSRKYRLACVQIPKNI